MQVIDRTFDILELIARAGDDVSISEVHATLGLPLGTVHRLMGMLVKRGYAIQDPRTRRYGPGPMLAEIGGAIRNQRFDLQHVAQAHLGALATQTGETSNLVVRQGKYIVYLAQVPSRYLVRTFVEVGQRAPLYCTGGGKAILSGFSSEQLDEYLASFRPKAWTPKTITSAEELKASLAAAQESGFALDNEERELGVRCVAAPIFDRTGTCIAALSLSGPVTRIGPESAEQMGPLVREAAEACSAQLGYRGSQPSPS